MPALAADVSVPALLLKVGQYPLHSGGVAVIRSLGRLGVPTYAITEDRWTPAALSRYCAGRFIWRVTGHEEPGVLAAKLRSVGVALLASAGKRSVLVPVDDEAATLVAEHEQSLTDYFLFPKVPPGLPRELASKQRLFELCREYDVPAPLTVQPTTRAELAAFAADAVFPVVIKNAEPWERRRAPVVAHTTVVRSAAELLAAVPEGGPAVPEGGPGVIVQEYIPREQAQDWIVHLYCDANSDCRCLFTGVKIRSWPPHNGATATAYALANPSLAQLTERFCKSLGFRGIADLDWRLDLRDGQYKLVDFNPRVGNQFRLFATERGIDVVRALHLDLTGREVPPGTVPDGRRIVVEHIDLPARLAYRFGGQAGNGYPAAPPPPPTAGTELAWFAADDPLPFFAMVPYLGSGARTRRGGHRGTADRVLGREAR
jgi:D-aspartate ligase